MAASKEEDKSQEPMVMGSQIEFHREPCPYRIIDDIGGAFSMGLVGGSLFHMILGARNSPRGERLAGSWMAVRTKAPTLGGAFATWGGLFSTFDCIMIKARGREDIWNGVIAGAMTSGLLAVRGGWRRTGFAAVSGGIFIGLIEGLGFAFQRYQVKQMQALARLRTPPPPPADPPAFDMREMRKRELDWRNYEVDELTTQRPPILKRRLFA